MHSTPAVFISHSSRDAPLAATICRCLEQDNVRCWVAPRDILSGEPWDEAIIRGISACRIVVFIFSAHSNESVHVKREIQFAFEMGKIVIPFRVEAVQLSLGLQYFMTGVHWMDATKGPVERYLGSLLDRVASVVEADSTAASASPASPESSASPTSPAAAPATPTYSPSFEHSAEGQAAAAAPVSPSLSKPPNTFQTQSPQPPAPPPSQPAVTATLHQTAKPLQIVLLYKRNLQPDERLLHLLETNLRAAGHTVAVDRQTRIGVGWAADVERRIREADVVIPLLSASSLQSEMLAMEIEIAAEAAQQQLGKPRLLPVHIDHHDGLAEPFFSILGRLHSVSWKGEQDDGSLPGNVLSALEAKEPPKSVKDEAPGGAVPLDSRFYIVQDTDADFHEALDRHDSIVLVKGARQMGKTSLLARGLQEARGSGATVVVLDFQKLNQTNLNDIESLYKALGGMIADQMDLDVFPEDVWREGRAPSVNFERYVRREVLSKVELHMILAMDEVDRLFSCPFASEVFGLFRSWHNERASNPDGPWGRLTLAIVYATEAHLFITDQNQSPFNVGTRLELHDFAISQVNTLNEIYGRPLNTAAELQRFYELFNGQPYLTRRSFYELTNRRKSFAELESGADSEDGPFGDHLRRILVLLARDKDLLQVVQGMLRGNAIPDVTSFYRLRSGGLVVGHSADSARFRCGIYGSYLKRHLG